MADTNDMDIMQGIIDLIREEVEAHQGGPFRKPLVGVTSADNPGFPRLRQAVHPQHLLPNDVLDGARSVLAFFLPFNEDIVLSNRFEPQVSRRWAEAYVEANRSIQVICMRVASDLQCRGVRAKWVPPTHNFDPEQLVSLWSHKHVAYLCGLGAFGINHQLITKHGCAGRLGSIVLGVDPGPFAGSPQQTEFCLEKRGGSCRQCVQNCPVGALTQEGLDKKMCYRWLMFNDRRFSDLPTTDVCGKCSVQRCAILHEGRPINENP